MMHHDSLVDIWHFDCRVFTVNGVGIIRPLDLSNQEGCMVFTLRIPRTIAQGPTWTRVVAILRDAGAVGAARETAVPRSAPVRVGGHRAAAH